MSDPQLLPGGWTNLAQTWHETSSLRAASFLTSAKIYLILLKLHRPVVLYLHKCRCNNTFALNAEKLHSPIITSSSFQHTARHTHICKYVCGRQRPHLHYGSAFMPIPSSPFYCAFTYHLREQRGEKKAAAVPSFHSFLPVMKAHRSIIHNCLLILISIV